MTDDIDPAAAGRRIGSIGGAARAAALTPERRREIAQKAARTRWGGKRDPVYVPPPSPQQELTRLVRGLPLPKLEKELAVSGAQRASAAEAERILARFRAAISLLGRIA